MTEISDDIWTLDSEGRIILRPSESSWPILARSLWSNAQLSEMYSAGDQERRQWEAENVGWVYREILPRPTSLEDDIKDIITQMFSYGASLLWWLTKLMITSLLLFPEDEHYISYIPVIQCYIILFITSTYQFLKHFAGLTQWSYFHGALDGTDTDDSDCEE